MDLAPIRREAIPFGIAGSGALNISAQIPDALLPLPAPSAKLFSLGFDVSGPTPLTFGKSGNVTLSIDASTEAKLAAIFPPAPHAGLAREDAALLDEFGLAGYFQQHPSDLLMTLQLGASADAAVTPSIRYQALSVQGAVRVAAGAGFTMVRAFPRDTPAGAMVADFAKGLRMPADIALPFGEGDVLAYEFGGYLRLGASMSLGYEIQGAPSYSLEDLKLTGQHSMGLLGTVGVQSSIAGRFAVQVRGVRPPVDMPAANPGTWVRVTVRRKRSREFSVAGDVTLRAASELNGLPGSSDEFLGALLGVDGRSWLAYLEHFEAKAQALASLDKLGELADGLAKRFIEDLTGTAFDQLKPQLAVVLQKLRAIVEGYQKTGQRATALVDRFFDRTEALVERLEQIEAAESWHALLGRIVDPDLARIVELLLGGDPLQFASGFAGPADLQLDKLKESARKTLDLIRSGAHQPILEVISLARQWFGLDSLFAQLAAITSEEELRARANTTAGGFASRLIGKAVADLKKSDLKKALGRLQEAVAHRKLFQERIYGKFREMAEQSLKLSLHAQYASSSEREALIDVLLNLEEEKGRQLLPAAAEGDFSGLIQTYRPPEHPGDPDPAAGFRPNAVRIVAGSLTHRTRRETAFRVNVIGWHRDWFYQGFDRVLVNTDQQIKADASGTLTVHTTIEFQKEKERRSGMKGEEERMYTNFVLRFLGESAGALEFDPKNQEFLIGVIRSMAARYDLSFVDEKTTAEELRYYLSFAQTFGLVQQGATFESIAPMLPSTDDNFGAVDARYQVVFAEQGLKKLLGQPLDERAIRQVMRSIVFANYLRDSTAALHDIAWCYSTPEVYGQFRDEQNNFSSAGLRQFPIAGPQVSMPVPVPASVTLRREQLILLSTLYRIEDQFVEALQALQRLLQRPPDAPKLSPQEFAKALSSFGAALKRFDSFDEGVNTVFAVFDQLIRAAGGETLRGSSLRIQSRADGREVEKIFLNAGLSASARAMG